MCSCPFELTMLPLLLLLPCVVSASESRSFACTTPNKENGTCIYLNDCRPIKQAVTYYDEDAINFAQASQCDYDVDRGTPLVCCGSVGYMISARPPTTTTAPPAIIPTYSPAPPSPIESEFLPDRSLCGLQASERKTEDGDAQLAEFPWIALLFYRNTSGGLGYNCTGTLINEGYVLTAAECVSMSDSKLDTVRLGEWTLDKTSCIRNEFTDGCENPVVNVKVEKVITHALYNPKSGNNNIALVKLAEKVKYTEYVRAVCLPSSSIVPPKQAQFMSISSWSLDVNDKFNKVKQIRKVVMVRPDECNRYFTQYKKNRPNMECIAKPEGNICVDDSGAPLLRTYPKSNINEQTQYYQEGIVYRGLGCPNKNVDFPALYLRVAVYIDWILGMIQRSP